MLIKSDVLVAQLSKSYERITELFGLFFGFTAYQLFLDYLMLISAFFFFQAVACFQV